MKKSRFAIAAALLALSFGSIGSALAQDNGMYVSASGVASSAKFSDSASGTLGKRASGYDLTVGGAIGQNIALEATAIDMGTRSFTVVGVGAGEMTIRGYGLHFVFSQPVITPGLSAFVRAGFLRTELQSGSHTASENVPSMGIGAEYRLNPDFSVGVSFNTLNRVAHATPSLDLDYTRVTVKYHF